MGLFNRRKAESVEKYQPPEQSQPEMPARGDVAGSLQMIIEQMRKLQESVAVLSQNDQVLLDAIGGTRKLLVELAGQEPEEEQAEPTQEEIEQAIIAARREKMTKAPKRK